MSKLECLIELIESWDMDETPAIAFKTSLEEYLMTTSVLEKRGLPLKLYYALTAGSTDLETLKEMKKELDKILLPLLLIEKGEKVNLQNLIRIRRAEYDRINSIRKLYDIYDDAFKYVMENIARDRCLFISDDTIKKDVDTDKISKALTIVSDEDEDDMRRMYVGILVRAKIVNGCIDVLRKKVEENKWGYVQDKKLYLRILNKEYEVEDVFQNYLHFYDNFMDMSIEKIISYTRDVTVNVKTLCIPLKDCSPGKGKWVVGKIKGSGAYGSVRSACCSDDCSYVLKYQPLNKDNAIEIRQEIKIQRELGNLGLAPKIFDQWECKGGVQEASVFVMQALEKTLLSRLEHANSEQKVEFFKLAIDLADRIHSAGYYHGDMHLNNIMILEDKLYAIDFGRSGYIADTDFNMKDSDIMRIRNEFWSFKDISEAQNKAMNTYMKKYIK